MFVARISRGRTIREFVLGVVAAPTGFGFIWFAIVGGTGIELQRTGRADLLASVATPELSLFTALDALPLATITSAVCVFLIALFFVSGADAASVVMGTMSSRGALEPSRGVVVVWGSLTGLAAAVLLVAGGLTALQQAAIIAAAPFVLIVLGACVGLLKEMRTEPPPVPAVGQAPPASAPVATVTQAPPVVTAGDVSVGS